MNKIFFIMSFFILVASCAPRVPDADTQRASAADIVKRVELFQGVIRSVKGLARVRIKTPLEKVSYTQVTVAREPNLLRLEALNPFGSTVGFISSDGENIYIISSSERDVYDSREEFDLSYVYPGLDLRITADSLVNLVMGRLPYKIYDSPVSPVLTADSGHIKLTYKDAGTGSENHIWVNPENYRVEKADFSLANGKRAMIRYDYFGELVDGHYFPKEIDFKTGELSINIVYEPDVELNKNVDGRLFKPST
ncbi:MAG: hypothetical protein RIG61_06470 [Deltaproteobacteria bacterium]